MAKLQLGIFGPISGKIGPVIGSSWNGIPYLKRASGNEKKPPTPAQAANQAKFKYANEWLIPFHPFLTVGFVHFANRRTAISAAFSANYKEVFIGAYPNLHVDFEKLIISKGSLPELNTPQITFVTADTLKVTWLQSSNISASYNDQVMLLIYNADLKIADGFVGGTTRAAGQCNFQMDPRLIGKPLKVYISAISLDRKKVADSQYLGTLEPL